MQADRWQVVNKGAKMFRLLEGWLPHVDRQKAEDHDCKQMPSALSARITR